jgi:hypothetical protein
MLHETVRTTKALAETTHPADNKLMIFLEKEGNVSNAIAYLITVLLSIPTISFLVLPSFIVSPLVLGCVLPRYTSVVKPEIVLCFAAA